ncbi:MAG: hypothetical protein Pg6C_02010 [Treponemataceae bacterium]|nr:MAG: hypothetical protein Pg6C_02010 [Treponemataceae bacterium]
MFVMKQKIIIIVPLLFLSGLVFAQDIGLDAGLGFQYGWAWEVSNSKTLREIHEPGLLANVRVMLGDIGAFGRVGLLFPDRITEGGITISNEQYDYMLFVNGGLGIAFRVPISDRFGFVVDTGISINDVAYGGSYTDTIDARWSIKLENLGASYSGGHIFENIKMKETYNDVSFGLLLNTAFRINLASHVYMEIGSAFSFDFLRYKMFEFSADLKSGASDWPANAKAVFPADKLDDPDNPTKVILNSDNKMTVFKQFTVIPCIMIGFRL